MTKSNPMARLIPRMQLVELMDEAWFPDLFRDMMTDHLATMLRLAKPFDPLAPRLAALLAGTGATRIIDLCSGAGGPWSTLGPALFDAHPGVEAVVLTDLYPNPRARARLLASDPRFVSEPASIDARDVPERLGGVRTIFDGFHHFRPEDARAILADAATRGTPIVVAEGVERDLRWLVALLLSPLFVLLVTPFVRPFSLARLVFTYLVPLLPLFVLFDGLVSWCRIYTGAELRALVEGLETDTYAFRVERFGGGAHAAVALVGAPRSVLAGR